jgi:hypothetical protein
MCNWSAAERYGDIIVREKNAPRRQRGVFCIVNQVCAEAGEGARALTFLLSLDQMGARGILAKFHNSPRWAAAAADG